MLILWFLADAGLLVAALLFGMRLQNQAMQRTLAVGWWFNVSCVVLACSVWLADNVSDLLQKLFGVVAALVIGGVLVWAIRGLGQYTQGTVALYKAQVHNKQQRSATTRTVAQQQRVYIPYGGE